MNLQNHTHNQIVTIFGGNGFIGRYVVASLARTGMMIRIASRHPQDANFLKTCGSIGQIIPLAIDVTDTSAVASAVEGSIVCHQSDRDSV